MINILITTSIILPLVAISVTFHEFGHYFVAKRLGYTVNVFNVGIGPKLVSFRYKKTHFSYRLIPLGGFIEIEEDCFEYPNLSHEKPSTLKKFMREDASILFAGPFFNLILAVLSLVVMFSLLTFNIHYPGDSQEVIHSAAGIAFTSVVVKALGFVTNLIPLPGSDGMQLFRVAKSRIKLKKRESAEANEGRVLVSLAN